MHALSDIVKPSGLPHNWPHSSPEDLEHMKNRIVMVGYEQLYSFRGNSVKTSKYELYNFLPKFLLEEFNPKTKIANCYFLVICCLQCIPQISDTGGIPTTLIPLVFIVVIDGIFAALEDIARHRADRHANASRTRHLAVDHDGANQGSRLCSFKEVAWSDINVGDFVRVHSRETVPADLVLIDVAPTVGVSPGVCFVETKSIDGETNLKIRNALPISKPHEMIDLWYQQIHGEVEMEHPNNHVDSFTGVYKSMKEEHSKEGTNIHPRLSRVNRSSFRTRHEKIEEPAYTERIPIQPNNILLRGCVLRNNDWIVGMVVNTGHDSKIMMTSTKAVSKFSSVEIKASTLISYIIVFLLFLGIVASTARLIWNQMNQVDTIWYLDYKPHYFVEWILSNFYYLLLHSSIIPVSLYVSMTFARFGQTYFMLKDLDMYYALTDTAALVRTMTLNEELGQVSHIFSDKTGTLTSNIMEFRKMSINGTIYGKGITDIGRAAWKLQGKDVPEEVLEGERLAKLNAVPHVAFYCDRYNRDINDNSDSNTTHRNRIMQFMRLLAVCHDAIREDVLEEGSGAYLGSKLSASNPDDQALVSAANHFGFEFTRREEGGIIVITERLDKSVRFVTSSANSNDIVSANGKEQNSSKTNSPNKISNQNGKLNDSSVVSTSNVNAINSITPSIVENDLCLSNASSQASLIIDESFRSNNSKTNPNTQTTNTINGSNGNNNTFVSPVKQNDVPRVAETLSESSDSSRKNNTNNLSQSCTVSLANVQTAFTATQNTTQTTIEHRFQVLQTIAFSSKRKRMSVIVKDLSNGTLTLFCKGAETVIYERLSKTKNDPAFVQETDRHLQQFATEGLRCLLLGFRELNGNDENSEYQKWSRRYEDACSDLVEIDKKKQGLDNRIEELESEMETELILIGSTAIEDRLQNGVPETIEKLVDAGINIWVLTGDKEETAINIAVACNLVLPGDHMRKIIVNKHKYPTVKSMILMMQREIESVESDLRDLGPPSETSGKSGKSGKGGSQPRAMIVDGPSLVTILKYGHLATADKESTNNNNNNDNNNNNNNNSNSNSNNSSDSYLVKVINTVSSWCRIAGVRGTSSGGLVPPRVSGSNRVQPMDVEANNTTTTTTNITNIMSPEEEEGRQLFAHFATLVSHCRAVVACRVSPDQKRQVVSLVRHGALLSSGGSSSGHHRAPSTLAIGDGANDVAMIKEAHIGVGIKGEEGVQAVNASDYAIAQFRFLGPLLLKHGRYNYIRLCRLICYTFYKNTLMTMGMFWFNLLCGFSGQKPYMEAGIQFYNLFFTSLPILIFGSYDRDVPLDVVYKQPKLYQSGVRNTFFTNGVFFYFVISGILDSLFYSEMGHNMLGPCLGPGHNGDGSASSGPRGALGSFWESGHLVYTVTVVTANLKMFSIQCQWSLFHGGVLVLGVSLWLLVSLGMSEFYALGFDTYYLLMHVMGDLKAWSLGVLMVTVYMVKELLVTALGKTYLPSMEQLVMEDMITADRNAKNNNNNNNNNDITNNTNNNNSSLEMTPTKKISNNNSNSNSNSNSNNLSPRVKQGW